MGQIVNILSTSDEFGRYMYDTYDPTEGRLGACLIVSYQSLMTTRAIHPLNNRQRDLDKRWMKREYEVTMEQLQILKGTMA